MQLKVAIRHEEIAETLCCSKSKFAIVMSVVVRVVRCEDEGLHKDRVVSDPVAGL